MIDELLLHIYRYINSLPRPTQKNIELYTKVSFAVDMYAKYLILHSFDNVTGVSLNMYCIR